MHIYFHHAYFIILIVLVGCRGAVVNEAESPKATPNADELSHISSLLDSIHTEDQQYRMEAMEASEELGWESDEFQMLIGKMMRADSSNMVVVDEILQKYGWLGADQIGHTANSTLFLVIQHNTGSPGKIPAHDATSSGRWNGAVYEFGTSRRPNCTWPR